MQLDTTGIVNRTAILKRGLEGVDYTLADESIQSQEDVTRKEQEDEQRAVRDIIGSGADVPLPQGANHQLRLQTMQQYVTELLQTNPVVQKKVRETPEIMDVLKTRLQYHQRQIQQQANALIGKIQVKPTFGQGAPQMALPQQ
jgi:hypothetical protein